MRISVYITSFNQAAYLATSIQSVLNQSIDVYEIIIIDDASTDHSRGIIDNFFRQNPNLIKPIFNHTNEGIVANRNKAIEYFSGDYLSGIDGDDYWHPEKLQLEYDALKKAETDFAFSNHFRYKYDDDLRDIYIKAGKPETLSYKKSELFEMTLLNKFGVFLYRSELVAAHVFRDGYRYDPQLLIYEDYDFKIRLSHAYKGVQVKTELQGYRENPNGLSKRNAFSHLEAIHMVHTKNAKLVPQNLLSEFERYKATSSRNLIFKAHRDKLLSTINAFIYAKNYQVLDFTTFKGIIKQVLYR